VWLEGRDGVVDESVSPALADAIARGVGRLEWTVLAHRYRHLSPLLAPIGLDSNQQPSG
jgi:hypothetical protein